MKSEKEIWGRVEFWRENLEAAKSSKDKFLEELSKRILAELLWILDTTGR